MRTDTTKTLTTLTTLVKILIYKTFGVVSLVLANLPQGLPQPATLHLWQPHTTLIILNYNNLQRCGKW